MGAGRYSVETFWSLLTSQPLLPFGYARPMRLTAEQSKKLLAQLREKQAYFDRLARRVDELPALDEARIVAHIKQVGWTLGQLVTELEYRLGEPWNKRP